MKKSLFASEYVSPYVAKVDMTIEKGFAMSIGNLPDDDDGIFGDEYSFNEPFLIQ